MLYSKASKNQVSMTLMPLNDRRIYYECLCPCQHNPALASIVCFLLARVMLLIKLCHFNFFSILFAFPQEEEQR